MKFKEYIKSECLRFMIMFLTFIIALILFFLIGSPVTELILLFSVLMFSEIIFIIVDFSIEKAKIKELDSNYSPSYEAPVNNFRFKKTLIKTSNSDLLPY